MKTAIIVVIALLIIGGGVWAYYASVGPSNAPGQSDQVVCTMDAKLCPDGSYVGRIGPDCQFAQCPGSPGGTSTSY
ncbi:MAG TPA: hypothetical protein VHD69_00260 [Candidatus Paceibacterota bacterium]|jgi:hypothetical protein|nr:hypothetical protein [Candidatus Paceibacterota bacterium]